MLEYVLCKQVVWVDTAVSPSPISIDSGTVPEHCHSVEHLPHPSKMEFLTCDRYQFDYSTCLLYGTKSGYNSSLVITNTGHIQSVTWKHLSSKIHLLTGPVLDKPPPTP